MRVVVDTNVVVAGFSSRRGASNALLVAAARQSFQLLATPPLFLEYEEVLKRPEQLRRAGLSLDQTDRALRGLASIIVPVDVRFLWRPQLTDADDEMVLEAAVNGRADRLVTFNGRDFGPASRFGIGVVTPRQFLQELDR